VSDGVSLRTKKESVRPWKQDERGVNIVVSGIGSRTEFAVEVVVVMSAGG
jgi:hypothetical protein